MDIPICPYTGQPRATRYHRSKALDDIVFLHNLDRYSDQDLLSLRVELEATMPGPLMPLHENHHEFLQWITAIEASRKAV